MIYSHSLSREERASLTLCEETRTDKFRQKLSHHLSESAVSFFSWGLVPTRKIRSGFE